MLIKSHKKLNRFKMEENANEILEAKDVYNIFA